MATIALFENEKISAYANKNNQFYKYTVDLATQNTEELSDLDKRFYETSIKPNFFIQSVRKGRRDMMKNLIIYSILTIVLATGGFFLGKSIFESYIWISLITLLFGGVGLYILGVKFNSIPEQIAYQRLLKIEEITGFTFETEEEL